MTLMQEDPIFWIGFTSLILLLLAFDLLSNRKAHVIETREALLWSGFWIGISLIFNIAVYLWLGATRAFEFLTSYVVEKALSVDNLFVFLLIFAYFNTPRKYQHRALYVGVVGALVFRGLFIATGLALITLFSWVIYVFGFFLIVSGARIAFERGVSVHPERNPLLRLTRRFFQVTQEYDGNKLLTRNNGLLHATPLLVVLIVIETTDIVFAVDSIPAVLAITRDPFIAYSSNIFAILGLRALYFALAGLQQQFYLLRYGLAGILVFIGGKMLTQDFLDIPIPLALTIVAFLFSASALASILKPQQTPNPKTNQQNQRQNHNNSQKM